MAGSADGQQSVSKQSVTKQGFSTKGEFDTTGFSIGSIRVGLDHPLFLIAGNCVIESEPMTMRTAEALVAMCTRLKLPLIYKSSFDKANRSSGSSYRGPGMEEGLRILQAVKQEFNVPVITDVHEDTPIDEVASVVDVLQLSLIHI